MRERRNARLDLVERRPGRHFAADYAEARAKFLAAASARGLAVETHVHPERAGRTARRSRSTSPCSGHRDAPSALLRDVRHAWRRRASAARGCQVGLLADDAFVASVERRRRARRAAACAQSVRLLAPAPHQRGQRRPQPQLPRLRASRCRPTTRMRRCTTSWCRRPGRRRPRTRCASARTSRRTARSRCRQAVSGGQCDCPDGLFYGGARADVEQRRAARRAARARPRRARRSRGSTSTPGSARAATARRSSRAATIAADVRARQGVVGRRRHVVLRRLVDVGAADRRQLFNAALRRMPGRRVHRDRARVRHAVVHGRAAGAARAISGSRNHPDAPADGARAIKRADARCVLRRTPTTGRRWCTAQARAAALQALTRAYGRPRSDGDERRIAPFVVAPPSASRRRLRRRGTATSRGASAIRRWRSCRPSCSRICLAAALFAPWVAPHNPFDLRTLNLLDALTPPAWERRRQGRATCSAPTTRDATCCRRSCSARASRCWSASRRSRSPWCSACRSGLLAGYVGGKIDAFIMRVADVQLSFPAILIALLIDGVRARGAAARRARRASRSSC